MLLDPIFTFQSDISRTPIPGSFNNPFGKNISEIARIAAKEFQAYIALVEKEWAYDFHTQLGKMFGILVIQKGDGSYGYIGTNSGKLQDGVICERFVPSVFDESADENFLYRSMVQVSELCVKVNEAPNPTEKAILVEERKVKSNSIQQWLFEQYRFENKSGVEKNVLEIFDLSTHGHPPAAAGECVAPKLLQYAFTHQLTPVAIAEFWWGMPLKTEERKHLAFYPACLNKCRPILEYMLEDPRLYEEANLKQ